MPTADQLEALRDLSDEEREELLRDLGIDRQGSTSDSADRRRDDARTDGERARERDRERIGEDPEFRRRILQPDDTIVVQIGFPRPSGPVQAPPSAGTESTQPSVPVPPSRRFDVGDAPLSLEQRERLSELIESIRAKNPYRLDRNGVLNLPGFGAGGIPMAGLNEQQATLRLQTEPAFQRLEVEVVRLPVRRIGPEGVKPFGYDLFGDESPSTFAPINEVPVPADYVVGSGDQLEVQLYGNQNRTLRLTVRNDGFIRFPELGPIRVGGKRFSAVQADIAARVARQMIGVRASVAMGDTRAIRVFVLGEVTRPGTYTVSGLATMTAALYASGGVKTTGSLRLIELRRQGQLVRRLDLYDLLIRGDTQDDAKLLPGDAIFVPPVGATVAVDGEVRRPALYELRDEGSIGALLQLAGGLTPEADVARASLSRIEHDGRRIVIGVQLDEGNAEKPRNGDALRILRLRPQVDSGVVLQGHVYRPGPYAYQPGMRLTDVIRSVDELRPNADQHYVLIRRELSPNRTITARSADLAAALRAPRSAADVELMPRDEIVVFDLEAPRDRVMEPMLEELRLQGGTEAPTAIVRVAGRVRAPGSYPLEAGMTVSDLVRAGRLTDGSYASKAELTRLQVHDGEARRMQLIEIDLAAAMRGEAAADIVLQPFDYLSIKEVPEWSSEARVTLRGEVRFPGIYPIRRGDTLQSVLQRAGGLTEFAFADGTVFTREELREREQEQLDRLRQRLQSDVTSLALQGAAANQGNAASTISVGQTLLDQLQATTAVGRLVIDLPRVMTAQHGSTDDIVLRHGDEISVPQLQQEITVIGEVQSSTSHLFRPDLGRDDYIALSGGTTRKADRGKIYVVRANGSVVAAESNRWFSPGPRVQMKQGDTVVVPLDTDRMPALPFWQTVTSIVYNLAIAAAAVNSF